MLSWTLSQPTRAATLSPSCRYLLVSLPADQAVKICIQGNSVHDLAGQSSSRCLFIASTSLICLLSTVSVPVPIEEYTVSPPRMTTSSRFRYSSLISGLQPRYPACLRSYVQKRPTLVCARRTYIHHAGRWYWNSVDCPWRCGPNVHGRFTRHLSRNGAYNLSSESRPLRGRPWDSSRTRRAVDNLPRRGRCVFGALYTSRGLCTLAHPAQQRMRAMTWT